MHEERGRAGRGERGGDLVGDVAGLAYSGDHHAPALRLEDEAVRPDEGLAEALLERAHGIGLDVEYPASQPQQVRIGQRVGL